MKEEDIQMTLLSAIAGLLANEGVRVTGIECIMRHGVMRYGIRLELSE